MNKIIDKLNESQKEAVNHIDGPCMVLAGPGSGKTRVIIYRIENMVINNNINPRSILAVSFTKASSVEMKNRALSLSNDPRMSKVTYGTFHSLFFRILRYFGGYGAESILDEKSKKIAIKGILKGLNVENGEDDEIISQVINEISYVKNELMDTIDFDSEIISKDEFTKTYNMYEDYKAQVKKIDFDDMLIKTYYLLQNNKTALETVRKSYKYILVDEFQDINKAQFEVLKLLASPLNNIFVVGDEDQSIYGFRGARPDFLLQFQSYFKDAKKIVLDINYRSKGEIIDIANRLIEKNLNRHEKVIKCTKGNGGIVDYIAPNDSEEEAVIIGKEIIEEMKKDYVEYSDFAIIYRTNIQSRALVDVFMDMRIPFVVKDSVITIYDHWTAQDVLAYLRIGLNPKSNKDCIRIINKPFRYISRDNINMVKDEEDFVNALINKCGLHPKQVKTINDLEIDLSYIKTLNPKNAISYIRTSLDYDRYILDYCTNRKIKTNGIIEILNELESSAGNFETICEYLDHIDRVKDELLQNKNNKHSDGVIFTTMHSSKGLEFKNVYIIGVNEGTVPHEKSYYVDDEKIKNDQLEEERRLFYVGITRAQEKLCISSTINKYGKKVKKSTFIDDIKKPTNKELDDVAVGDKIFHKKFKIGEVTEKNGKKIKVKFKDKEVELDFVTCMVNGVIEKIF